jgi:hypothetical protein
MGNATLTIRVEIEPGEDDSMYRLESMLLSDPAWRAAVEHGLAEIMVIMLAKSPGGEWAGRARLLRLEDERGTSVWKFMIGE